MSYKKVTNINEATHFIFTKDCDICNITVGKEYELQDIEEQDYFIFDDDGRMGSFWLCGSLGYFVRKED